MKTLAGLLLIFLLAAPNFSGQRKKLTVDPLVLYAYYNQTYWGTTLDTDPVIVFGDPGARNIAISWVSAGRAHIILSAELVTCETVEKETLLHEMSHLAIHGRELDDHGPKWRAEMHRLMDAGAFDDCL